MDVDQFIKQAIDRGDARGPWELSIAERLVYLISEAEIRCDMTGFESFTELYGERGVKALADAYRDVGAIELAGVLEALLPLFPEPAEELLLPAYELICSRAGYSYESIAAVLSALLQPPPSGAAPETC